MNRAKLIFIIFGIIFLSATAANAGVYNFQPNPANLDHLAHWNYYLWNINWTPPNGETITGATLSIQQIYNVNNPGDNWNMLYMHLLDNASTSGLLQIGNNVYSTTWQGGDNPDAQWDDAWAGNPLIANYSDPFPGPAFPPNPVNLQYNFDATLLNYLNAYSADGNFGLGFDPDCHFFNDGVRFEITTSAMAIPEPTSLALLGLGLLGLIRFRKRG